MFINCINYIKSVVIVDLSDVIIGRVRVVLILILILVLILILIWIMVDFLDIIGSMENIRNMGDIGIGGIVF